MSTSGIADSILGDCTTFIETVLRHVANIGISPGGHEIDHICYQTSTEKNFIEMKEKLSSISSSVAENEHNGRLIAKFILKKPLLVDSYSIPLIELPAPKPNTSCCEGLEHLEIVTKSDEEFDAIKSLLENLQNNKEMTIDTFVSNPRNPTLSVTFSDGMTAKFHKKSLQEVVLAQGTQFHSV